MRTLRHLTDRFGCNLAFIGGSEPGETCADAPAAPIDALVDERGTVKAGSGDYLIRPCKDESGLMVVKTGDVE